MSSPRFVQAGIAERILLCAALDPIPQISELRHPLTHLASVAEATADNVSCYTIDLSPFEPDLGGLKTPKELLDAIPDEALRIAEGGYIEKGVVGQQYAQLIFDELGFDAIVTTSFFGYDFVSPFVEHSDRCVFLRCAVPDEGAERSRSLHLEVEGQLFGEVAELANICEVAELANKWSSYGNIGLAIAATDLNGLITARRLCPDLPILVTGADGANVELGRVVVEGLSSSGSQLLIQTNRDITYASQGDDFAVAASSSAQEWRKRLDDLTTAASGR